MENKVNVLLCSPNNKMAGGISKWTGHILKYYAEIDSVVKLKHFYSKGQGAYLNTPMLQRWFIGIVSYLPFLYGLRNEFRNNKFDVVHFTSSASISLMRDILSLKIARIFKVKTVVHFRFGRIPQIYEKKNWEQKLLHIVVKLADIIIVLDHKSYRTLKKYGYNNIEILPNPLSCQVNECIRNNSQISKINNKIVFAGQVLKTKGIEELVRACKSIKNIQLKVIGFVYDKEKKDLMELAGNSSNEWLEFTGELSTEDTIKEMLSAGIFVLPTYTEGFPNVIIESMACGCPIIASNVGAIPEMLDIENGDNYGLCIEPKNVEQLQNSIIRMLDDRDYANRCGENAKRRVNEFYSMPIVWDRMESIWKSLIN